MLGRLPSLSRALIALEHKLRRISGLRFRVLVPVVGSLVFRRVEHRTSFTPI